VVLLRKSIPQNRNLKAAAELNVIAGNQIVKISVIFVLCVLSFSSYAESIKPILINPIVKELHECVAKIENETTAGRNNCINAAAAAWDKELNVIYKKLMSSLSSKAKEDLKKSQMAWLKHRDLEFKLINSVYEDKIGTMYTNIKAMNILVITQNRTLELE
jgi:uncharacterized protein YecT (DUF1311 family)